MKQHRFVIIYLIVIMVIFTTACGSNAPTQAVSHPTDAPSATTTSTPNPCSGENIETEVQKVHKFMREFDDASSLASILPVDQLGDAISNLQKIRREAEDQPTPICLVDLKTFEISHMNSVISTMLNLIGYANGTVDKQVIDQGIAFARDQHDKYTIELARVLGLTVVPVATTIPPTQTPTP